MAGAAKDGARETADLETLAERYLDLWQDQVAAMASDADLAAAFQSLLGPGAWMAIAGPSPVAAWQAMMSRYAATAAGPSAGEPKSDDHVSKRDGASSAPAGTAAAATAPDGGGTGLEQLARRIAALEARIATLEVDGKRQARGGGGTAPRANRRKRS